MAAVDVTDTAREAAERHGAGPAATAALGETLAAVVLLTTHLKNDDEALSFQLEGDGPLRGVLAEVWGEGRLRGYTQQKRLEAADELLGQSAVAGVLGQHGTLTVMHSSPDNVLYSGTVLVRPASPRAALATYFNRSQQIPAAVALHRSPEGRMVGVVAEKLPNGDTEAFVAVLESFSGPGLTKTLARTVALSDLGPALALPDLRELERRPLTFGCRCSEEKVLDAMAALPATDLREIVASGEAQNVDCHFCGHRYEVGADLLDILLRERDKLQ